MMQKAWSSIEKVPYCFSRSSVKFQGHTGQKIADFDPNRAFLDCNSSLNSPMALKWCTKLDVTGALLFSEVIHQISRSHGLKNRWFWSNLSKITRPVAAIKSLRFALLFLMWNWSNNAFRLYDTDSFCKSILVCSQEGLIEQCSMIIL